ncbi:hypothetical protein HPB48_007120 [Haemaphysalis longicornis]|uniref:Peptidase M13 N-terminal domain-containing protein n=1 Tax=Haemaphysalis longicornis TaxID=44386 RepID=A0A9J6FQS2_HAELO|nr:hypothetical protein HPB48_007120 [Haemaphysalis longicornis]
MITETHCWSVGDSSESLPSPPAQPNSPYLSPARSGKDRHCVRHVGREGHCHQPETVPEAHWAIVVALVASTSIVFIALAFIGLGFAVRSGYGTVRGGCSTPACNKFAELLSASIDASEDPCTDFYKYVCGKRKHIESVYAKQLSDFVGEAARILRDTRFLPRGLTSSERAAQLYRSCESVLMHGKDDLDNFRQVLAAARISWPRLERPTSLLRLTTRIRITFGISSFLGIRKQAQLTLSNSPGGRVLLEPGCLFSAPSPSCDAVALNESFSFYESVVMAVMASSSTSWSEISFAEAVNFEKDLIKTLTNSTSRGSTVVESATLDVHSLARLLPYFDESQWAEFVAHGADIANASSIQITVTNVDFLNWYGTLVQKNDSMMAWYTSWLAVSEMAPFVSREVAAQRFGNDVLDKSVPKICLRFSERHLGVAAFGAYIYQKFVPDFVIDINGTTAAVRASFREKVVKSAWFVSSGNYNAINSGDFFWLRSVTAAYQQMLGPSLKGMSGSIAQNWVIAANHRRRFPGNETFWTALLDEMNTQPSYSFFTSRRNSVRLPLYATMLPIYDAGLTPSIKLGTLGVLLAVATFRNLVTTLGPDVADATGRSLRCFSGPLGNETYNLELDRAVPVQIVEECLRGIKPASSGRRLAHLSQFTETQTFFLAMCYLLCDPAGVGGQLERACNEAVRHSTLFSSAFTCARGSKMNPREKCNFF